MLHEIEAIYEHGILRPLTPLALDEHQHVRLTVTDGQNQSPNPGRDLLALEEARSATSTSGPVPTIEEVRAALSSIPGSLSDLITAERGED